MIPEKISKKYRWSEIIQLYQKIAKKIAEKKSVEIFHLMSRLRIQSFRGFGDDIRADGQTDSVQNILYRLIVH